MGMFLWWVRISRAERAIGVRVTVVLLYVWNGTERMEALLFFYYYYFTFHEIITKTRLYNFDLLKPHFYVVKLGFTGIYIIFFLFLLKNIDCGYSLEPPRRYNYTICSQRCCL